jgi:SAM-dependent methyltransferase
MIRGPNLAGIKERAASLLYPASMKDRIVAKNEALLSALVPMMAKDPDAFKSDVSVEDEMYITLNNMFEGNGDEAYIEYLRTGKQMMDLVTQVARWHFGGFYSIGSFLEFACGYGRFTRFLIEEVPAQRVWGADIYADAIKFQKKQFGVNGVVSTKKPEDYHDKQQYDFIFVASLFSHLPEDTFLGWLRRLFELLAPDGVLMFSVHDVDLMPVGHTMPEKGILFIEETESRTLTKEDYGYTLVTEAFVSKVIHDATAGKLRYYRVPKCLYQCQCVYIVVNNPAKDFSDFTLCPGPMGAVDISDVTNDRTLNLSGWATDFCRDHHRVDVHIIVNGEVIDRCEPRHDRLDIVEAYHDDSLLKAGWSCSVSLAGLQSSDTLIVKAINSRKLERILKIENVGAICHDRCP